MAETSSHNGKLPKIKACIFDMDGLLIDSERVYTHATNRFLEPYNKRVTWDFKIKVMGLPAPAAIRVMLQHYDLEHVDPDEVAQQLSSYQDEMFRKVQPLPGAIKLLQHLKQNNIPIAMATGSQKRNLILKTSHLPELIACFPENAIVTGDDSRVPPGRGKPCPDVFQVAARAIGFATVEDCAQCLVFEDGIAGVIGAVAANMPVVWCPDPELVAFQKENPQRDAPVVEATQTLTSLEQFKPEDWSLPPPLLPIKGRPYNKRTLNTATALPRELITTDGILGNLASGFLHLPELLPGCPPYAVTIITGVLVLRAVITLPVAIWQRKRTDRLQDIVVPALKAWSRGAAEQIKEQCRRQKLSYSEYRAEFARQTKSKTKELQREHHCSPRPTLLVPLLANVPIFVLSVAAIREACSRAIAFKAYVADAAASVVTSAGQSAPLDFLTTSVDATTAKHLLELSTETNFLGQLMVTQDASYIIPFLIGLNLLANTELTAAVRRGVLEQRTQKIMETAEAAQTEKNKKVAFQTSKIKLQSAASGQRPIDLLGLKTGRSQPRPTANFAKRSQSTKTATPAEPLEEIKDIADSESKRKQHVQGMATDIITNVMRVGSIAMIVISAQAPLAINLYLFTSSLFTLGQSAIFFNADRIKSYYSRFSSANKSAR